MAVKTSFEVAAAHRGFTITSTKAVAIMISEEGSQI
jgi:hypothetical protein